MSMIHLANSLDGQEGQPTETNVAGRYKNVRKATILTVIESRWMLIVKFSIFSVAWL